MEIVVCIVPTSGLPFYSEPAGRTLPGVRRIREGGAWGSGEVPREVDIMDTYKFFSTRL